MLVTDLETKIVQAKSEGCQPFLVVATAGTTVLGAFDNINDIADVCVRHSLWLHVDVSNVCRSCVVKLGSCTRAGAYLVGRTRRPRNMFF